MSYTTDREAKRQENRQNSIIAYFLFLLALIATFLLIPGMVTIALVADLISVSLAPSQMWAFSFVISVCLFIVLRVCSPSTKAAGLRYIGISGVLTTIFVLFLFGLEATFAKRWVVRFVPPSESPSTPSPERQSTTSTTSTASTASTAEDNLEAQPQIRRAIPVSHVSNPEPVEKLYSVTGIARGDSLNVRSGPGANNSITAKLPNGFTKLRVVGTPVMNGTTEWVQIRFGDRTGWATKQYLQPE